MSQVNITCQPRRRFAWQNAKSAGLLSEPNGDRRRFWAKVAVLESDTACWEWTAGRYANGYGQFMWAGRYGRRNPQRAHRAAWELTQGDIPAGQHVLHSCDNPACVNPNHLFLGTHTDNMQDASRKGRLSLPRKSHRDIQAEAIRRYLAGGVTQRDLAAEYGVCATTVLRWLKPHKQPYQRGGKVAA